MRTLTAEDVWHLHALPALIRSPTPHSGSRSGMDLDLTADPRPDLISERDALHLAACLALPLASGLLNPPASRTSSKPISSKAERSAPHHLLEGAHSGGDTLATLLGSREGDQRHNGGLIYELTRCGGIGVATTSGRVTMCNHSGDPEASLPVKRSGGKNLPQTHRLRGTTEGSSSCLVLFPPSLGNKVDFDRLLGPPPTTGSDAATPSRCSVQRLGWDLLSDAYASVGSEVGIPVGHWRWLFGLLGGVRDLPQPVRRTLRGVPSAVPPTDSAASGETLSSAPPLWPLPDLHPPLPQNDDDDGNDLTPGSWLVKDWHCPPLDRMLSLMLKVDLRAPSVDENTAFGTDSVAGGSHRERRKAKAKASAEARDALKSKVDRMGNLAGLLAERWPEYSLAMRAEAVPSTERADDPRGASEGTSGHRDLPSTFCLLLGGHAWLPNSKGDFSVQG